MKKRSYLLLACLAALSTPALAAPAATVNGVAIDQSQVDVILSTNPNMAQSPQAKTQVLNNLVAQEILAQAARAGKLEQSPQVQARLALANRQILANAAIDDYLAKHPVSDEELRSHYQSFVKDLGDKEYRARHILVKSQAEAEQIMASLKKGANFAKLAKEKSLDKGSAQNGGELGWFPPSMMVKPFADALNGAKKGALLGPVKTEFGYHIIQLEDTRKLTPPPFDAVKERLRADLQQQKIQSFVDAQRAQAKIDLAK